MPQTIRAKSNVPLALYTGGCVCCRIRDLIRLPADEPDEPLPKAYLVRAEWLNEFKKAEIILTKQFVICHCIYCKKNSGSSFSKIVMHLQFHEFARGEPKAFMDSTGESTPRACRRFCGDCRTPWPLSGKSRAASSRWNGARWIIGGYSAGILP